MKPVSELFKPVIVPPLCDKGQKVKITNFKPGSTVVIKQDEKEIAVSGASESTCPFDVYPPLVAGRSVSAYMQLCDTDGLSSESVPVDKGIENYDLKVATAFQCAAYISIANPSPTPQSATIFVTSKEIGMISSYYQFSSDYALIPVSPGLSSPVDEITVHAIVCGGAEKSFGPFKVKEIGKLNPPHFDSILHFDGGRFITVFSDYAGAMLIFSVDDVPVGQAISRGDLEATSLFLQNPLQLNQEIKVKQTLCDQSENATTNVINPLPQIPKLIKPSFGAIGIPISGAIFEWEDPGVNTSAEATSFEFKLFHNGPQILSVPLTQVYTLDLSSQGTTLEYDTGYSWGLQYNPSDEPNYQNRKDPSLAIYPKQSKHYLALDYYLGIF